ncbi:disintegrin and metalloproteinase domain-containing protein 1a-like [Trichechus manatus latirostris]|uniref:Disintegrin and metalloproteinase domain-containing protein 1a-like n=1 Tax=Trichechus manatus latirostris TaxID=127582 RepID=A0A2Y9DQL9_TRIMA|nr:disintegrin and metalloproteinase domain-containing protein 1a-like [Trichechus manatus latirostris]
MSVAASVRDSASVLPSLQKNQVIMNKTERALHTWTPQMKGLRLGLGPVVPSRVKLGIMLLVGMIFLPRMYCGIESVYYSSYEIVIPQSLTVKGREDPVEKASYMLYMQGQKQVIHLKVKKDYFVSSFPVFSYHNGILEQEMPFISHDCHYEGYIEGVPGSFVSVNTCSGLKGILIKEEQSYGIEPMESSKRFEHVLYTMAHQAPVSCSVTSNKSQQGVSTSRQQGSRKLRDLHAPSYLWSHTKYVEMFVVVNHLRFQMWGSNINETIQGVMDIIALANSFTRGINTEVVLAGMEIWTEGDLIEVPVDLQVTLRNFNSWRQQKLFSRVKHDVAHMIVGHHPGQNMGQAFLSGACSSGFAAAVESFHHEDVLLFAALMVHELGHNLGIQHDHSACICKDKYFCLMHENITKVGGFSNCSSDSFYQFLHEHKGACLFNKPGHKGRTRRDAICGNGIVDNMEQCDCGPNCASHPCCSPSCTLKPQAQCSHGICCSSCKFKSKGVPCRRIKGECDLPEYCDGQSETCPSDVYKQDGTPCERTKACVLGQCNNPDNQCMTIYGYQARSAPENCYTSMNSKGDRFGNCGRPTTSNPRYVQCEGDNVFCGKIVCTNIEYLPTIKPQHTVIQIPNEEEWCFGIDAYNGTDIPDDGDVQIGTYCAPNKVCINYSCIAPPVLNLGCDPNVMCNGKGVCNNLKHCHCEYGFAPPNCSKPGTGGSVDSGPPGKQEETAGGGGGGGGGSEETVHLKEKPLLDVLIVSIPIILLLLLCLCIICCIYKLRYAPKKPPPTQKVPEEVSKEAPPEAAPEEAPEEEAAEEEAPEEEVPEEEAPEEEGPEEEGPEEEGPEEEGPEEEGGEEGEEPGSED